MPRRETALQRRITAWHEAAHAVVAFRFGIRVDELAICQAGPLAGYVSMLNSPLVSQRGIWDGEASQLTWALVQRDAERHAMLRLAGPVAEAKLFGTPMRSHTCESDLTSALRLCAMLEEYREHLAATRGLPVPAVTQADLAGPPRPGHDDALSDHALLSIRLRRPAATQRTALSAQMAVGGRHGQPGPPHLSQSR